MLRATKMSELPKSDSLQLLEEGENASHLVDRITKLSQERIRTLRPWSEFFAKNRVKVPENSQHLISRIQQNISYYISNYSAIYFILMIYCVLTNPPMLLAIAASGAAWFYNVKYAQDTEINGVALRFRERSIMLGACTLLLFYFVAVGETIFWMIGLGTTFSLVHAVFHRSHEELQKDEPASIADQLAAKLDSAGL